jgi:hypothetical protein
MLREFLEKALELGAEGLEVCYKDRQERIFAVRDPISSSAVKIDELLERVEALEGEVRDIRENIAPRERLRRVVERMRQRTKHIPPRELDRAITNALREARSGQGSH